MLACPRCRSALFSGQAAQIAMEACGHCGGVWLHKGHDERVLKALPPEAMRIARAASMLGPAPRDTSPPVPCPVCARVMERRKAAPSDVDIDVCAEHGSWFDHGELELIAKALVKPPPAPQGPPPGYALPGGGATPLRGGVGAGVAVGAVAGVAAAGVIAQQNMQQMQQNMQQGQSSNWEGAADVVEGVLEGADVVELAAEGAQAVGGLAGEAGSALAESGAAEALGAAAEAAGSLAEGAGEIIGGIFSLIGGLFEGL